MSRYIDFYLIGELVDSHGNVHYEDLKHLPTADVVPMEYHERCVTEEIRKRANLVEVVRCKDCDWFIVNEIKADGTTDKRYKPTWCTYHNGYMNDDDFCSFGERRGDD